MDEMNEQMKAHSIATTCCQLHTYQIFRFLAVLVREDLEAGLVESLHADNADGRPPVPANTILSLYTACCSILWTTHLNKNTFHNYTFKLVNGCYCWPEFRSSIFFVKLIFPPICLSLLSLCNSNNNNYYIL